jgi:sec-independent protein translocase protein TatA
MASEAVSARLRKLPPARFSPMTSELFGLGPLEIAVIVLLGVLLFGRRLPDVGRYVGKSIDEFRERMRDIDDDDDPGPTGVFARLKPKPPNLDGHAKLG